MKELICITCPKGCRLRAEAGPPFTVTGNACPRGAEYARAELTHPVRTLTTTVRIEGGVHRRLPVRTSAPVPKERLFDVMDEAAKLCAHAPVKAGQRIAADIAGTGADLVATRAMDALDAADENGSGGR